MKNTLYIALSRQTSLWNQLDMVSNNLANVNTAGYKGVQAHFTEHLSRSKTDEKLIDDRLSFTHDFGIVRDFTEGAFSSTGNPLDVAIHGDGYFVIETPQGIQYSRNGQFKLNSDGMIVNSNGYAVLDTNNNPIFIAPQETQINIARDGSISPENGPVATLQVVEFDDRQKLRASYGTLFQNAEGNNMTPVTPSVEQGMIEKSNVNAVVEMARMIKLQRAYENVQMMIDTEHSRRQNAIQAYARAGGQ